MRILKKKSAVGLSDILRERKYVGIGEDYTARIE
jgi:hypothetical protein